ncbi:tRNA1(Val) (adenine(37)-N6)-methyltransferase [Dyadobacter sp. CY356]|uniref:tRNA1(Val) (adenine(37)-N6)-methyltransferase n=1 Tax=Dyadobacter sp. CY356 TaxID=2906442 RepID=UPI001F2DCD0C|nr:methyltransferase [Dyadobacter sp. CY356]MCF0054460.1 methyltransferase [Dyadobacter sp. CY356]
MARNSFFKFKQFTINQDKSAMKVCTDACVFGAWADVEKAERILDIGAGTGLLSLMVAQRNREAKITAVEIDKDAFLQATENAGNSPFKSQIEVFNTAIQDFLPSEKFDCIITNPPFFQSDLKSPDAKINLAHHADSLSFEDLLTAIKRLLQPNGKWNILLPVDEGLVFQSLAENSGWKLRRELTLYHQKGKKPFRKLMSFQSIESADIGQLIAELFIYEEDGKTFHPEFRKLLKDFYLQF